MANEKDIPREVDPCEALLAHVEAQMAAAVEKRKTSLELTEALWPDEWEVFAWGPYQFEGGVFDPRVNPGRIIFTGETAYIAVVVWMNPRMCTVIQDHNDKILLNFYTSNMQTMEPAAGDLTHQCCIYTDRTDRYCFYPMVWKFTPEEAACLYETNICARICSCKGKTLSDYAGFVRQVYDFDPEKLWLGPPQAPGWQFDRPIRYMVANPDDLCCDESVEKCR
jgi:hypothetical protein